MVEFNDALFAHTDPRLLRRFAAYHAENPDVYAEFKAFAARIKATGRQKYSAWVIIQAIRWTRDVQTTGDVFKVNNDFIAIYARLLMVQHPEYRGFLELRAMKEVRKLSEEDATRQGVPQGDYQ